MLEDIGIIFMNLWGVHENEVNTWTDEYSPKSMGLYNEHLQIPPACRVNFNGENGIEIIERQDKQRVNFILHLQDIGSYRNSIFSCY